MLPRSIKGHIACRHIVNKFQLADAREAERNPKEAPNTFQHCKAGFAFDDLRSDLSALWSKTSESISNTRQAQLNMPA